MPPKARKSVTEDLVGGLSKLEKILTLQESFGEKLFEKISYLEKLISKLEVLKDERDTPHVPDVTLETSTDSRENRVTTPAMPVPKEYRDIVDSVLNYSFDIRINPRGDIPAFEFILVVPPKYSTVTQGYKQMYHEDLRPKVITYSDGLNGVRDWVDLVFRSFNPDIQALITNDRIKQ